MRKMFENIQGDSDIMKIVQSLWNEYDLQANGVMDRREARRFVADFTTMMNLRNNKTYHSYNASHYEKWFTAYDRDQSGTIDVREMTQFIRSMICESERPNFFTHGQKLETGKQHDHKDAKLAAS